MPIQNLHLRSSVQGKEPVAGSATGQLPVGSIGINFNAAEPFLTIQDSNGSIRRIAGIKVGATAPATPSGGEAWLDTTISTKPVFKVFDGTAWQGAGSGVSTGGTAPTSPLAGDLWVDTSVAGSPVLKVYNGTAWVVVTPDATTAVKGVVQLADAAAVTAGTVGRAVTADQLKATNDNISAASVWTRTGTDLGPTTAGDSVTTTGAIEGSDLTTTNVVSAAVLATDATGKIIAGTVPDATETVRGIAEIATTAEVADGTDDSRIVTPAKLSAFVTEQLKATWLPSNNVTPEGVGTSTWNGPADTLTATPAIEVKIASGAWGTGGAVAAASQVQVRWISATVAAAAHGTTLTGRVQNTAGNVGVDYSVVIDKLPGAITITPQSDTELSAAIDSAASTAISGLNAPARLWLKATDGTAAEVSVAGGSWVAIPTTAAAGLSISQGQTFRLRHTTKANVSEVTTTTVYVGWDVGSSVEATFVTTNTATLPALTITWSGDTDAYTRDPVADRVITAQVGMRRCVMPDGGIVAYYLDADDSTKKAGDWLRLVETTELSAPYTGTHGAEVANTALRAAAPAWAAGTYTKGQRVTHSGSVWECLAATTTATPAAGAVAANLTGADGQVMVEIPKFSVWHETAPAGSYLQHTFHLQLGDKTDGSWQVHPAFVKPDSSTRSHIYLGAYQGTGTNGNGSASGVNNTTNMTRAVCRTACAGRGAGWHQLGYWEYNAVQWLLYTEYQDMNSQKVLGDGSIDGGTYAVNTGISNSRGNRCGHATTSPGAITDYVSYRGIENVYGRAWQWADGFNANGLDVYLNNNPATWADDTQAGYTASGTVSAGSAYSRDLLAQTAFLPGNSTGASETTFTGDYMYTSSGWLVASVGGRAGIGARVGALCLHLSHASSIARADYGGRLSYAS